MQNNPNRPKRLDSHYEIYALLDPRDNTVRYVGITSNKDNRFSSHIHDPADLPKSRWIRELRKDGILPIMQVLETIEAGTDALSLACQRELYWINEMKHRGYSLLNVMGVTKNYHASYFPSLKSRKPRNNQEKPKPPERPIANPIPMKQRLKIKEIATTKGWTQTKLQRAADVHPSTMQGIYNDPYRDVAYSTLVKIAKVLGVDVSELTEEVLDKEE